MSNIVEQIEHPHLQETYLQVLERTKGEYGMPNAIIDFEVYSFHTYTPTELIELGEWLINHAKRIKKEYTSTGKKKTITPHP